jgi:hypothetical protein
VPGAIASVRKRPTRRSQFPVRRKHASASGLEGEAAHRRSITAVTQRTPLPIIDESGSHDGVTAIGDSSTRAVPLPVATAFIIQRLPELTIGSATREWPASRRPDDRVRVQSSRRRRDRRSDPDVAMSDRAARRSVVDGSDRQPETRFPHATCPPSAPERCARGRPWASVAVCTCCSDGASPPVRIRACRSE